MSGKIENPSEVNNVSDRRLAWIGSWTVEPLDYEKLWAGDVGRTVIYRDHGRAEAGTLVSWRDNTVFACYSQGDTAAGASPDDLVFGLSRADLHPDTPPHFYQPHFAMLAERSK